MNDSPKEPINLYLASKSPRRRELLTQIGVRYQCISVDVPEERELDEKPQDYVCRLAQSKAQAGAALVADSHIPVLGSDTVVVCCDQVLEKPEDQQQGVEMLLALAGREHRVLTAISLCTAERSETRVNTTSVRFRDIGQSEAERYWRTGEPWDKAGGYGIQGLGAVFVEQITGSYTGVVGLPLFETCQLLSLFNVPIWQLKE
ncbi:Maf family protein [Teredinibacter haidensis]|uniref:Maf family protein n=1 Tax=Teredinibacter haidensis TaxID=2731755 RepID=UPI000948A664|nr:Maf family protein [Teredinibacter haidensis]